jgi:hypothetical protein
MKTLAVLASVLAATTGCATLGTTSSNGQSVASLVGAPTSPAPDSLTPFPAQELNNGPQLVVPMTGGAPIFGIPVGGNLYIPVTGGPPVPGMPTSP